MALALFTIAACVIAVVSFNELRKSLDRIASTQLDTMYAAANLRQDSEAITALAPSLFVKGIEQSTLLDFSVQIYNRQAELNAQIGELARFVGAGDEIRAIEEASASLFTNIDALSTVIYGKAGAEAALKTTLRQVGSLLHEAEHIMRVSRRVKPGQVSSPSREIDALAAEWAREVELVNGSVLTALSSDDANRLAASKAEIAESLAAAAGHLALHPTIAAGLSGLQAQLESSLLGPRGIVPLREQLVASDIEVRQLLARNDELSRELIGAVDRLMNRVRTDIADENLHQGDVLSTRSHILEAVGVLGGLGALAIGLYFQFAVIRRLNRLRNYIRDESSVERPEEMTLGNDEISEMAETFVQHSAEIKLREEQLQIAKDAAESALAELKQTQQNLVQSEKMASLGQLTAGIAHEIKNPLNFINNFADLSVDLLQELKENIDAVTAALKTEGTAEIDELLETLASNLRKVREHGQRADRIVRSMLAHARQGSAEPVETDINTLVEDALNLAYHGARAENSSFNVTLERHYADNAGVATILPQEVTRVLLNLFTNGFYATQKRREQETGSGYAPTLTVATRDLGEAVEIRVQDNGTGIPASFVERIFEPFFTTKPTGEGTGLGLSLSYEIVVHQHNGQMDVHTAEGQFTEFIIVLPRKGAKAIHREGQA